MWTLESRRLRSVMRARTITRQCPAGRLRGGASAADRLACAGAAVATRARPAHARWRKMRTLELPAPPTAPTAVARIALPHAHGHARVQRAQPCSAARGRQPAGTAPGNGWRWRPKPLRCAIAPLVRDKTFGQPLSMVVPSPAPWRGQGLRGARRSRPGRTAQCYYRHPRTGHNWAL